MANNQMDGYAIQVSNKLEIITDHDGPASYNNTGTFATSGETINALDFGLGGFEFIDASDLSSDSINTVLAVMIPQNNGDASTSARLYWFVQATGAQVNNAVNLSTKAIRLKIRGV